MNAQNTFAQDITKVASHIEAITGKRIKTHEKAVKDMARALVGALYEADISVGQYLLAYKKDEIFDPSCLLNTSNDIFAFVKPQWQAFARVMFCARPVGLGTPQAMVGEGEFMAVFTSPRVGISKKKNAGDITVDGKTIELKGDLLRIFGKVHGRDVQKSAAILAQKYKIKPNKCNGGRLAFEPWDIGTSKKLNKPGHWIKQFQIIGQENSATFLFDLCKTFVPNIPKTDIDMCFSASGVFDGQMLQKVILIELFNQMKKDWNAFTIIDEGRIQSITDCQVSFRQKVLDDEISVTNSYFRAFQPQPIGFYVVFNKAKTLPVISKLSVTAPNNMSVLFDFN